MKKHYSIWLAPLAVLGVLCLLYGINGLYPFGENTISWGDMNQQVVPLLLELRNILHGEGSLFYTMQTGGGMNFYGVFLFFLSSPFSFLSYFVQTGDMKWFMNLLLILKLMTCAVTAAVFFRVRFPNLRQRFGALLAVCYAFSGYTLLFYQNIVWLDVMYLFPLLLLGLDWTLNRRKPLLYILSLCAIMACQFYLGYMVVIFLLLAVAVWVFWAMPKENRGRACACFVGASLVAALLTGVIWVPALLQFMSSARGEGLVESLTSGGLFTYLSTTLPFLCSSAILVVSLFFLRKLRGNRRLQAVLIVFLLCAVPLVLEPVNKMWHTGSYQAFPVRYGFITLFLGFCLTAWVLQRIQPKTLPQHTSSGALIGVWVALVAAVAVEGVLLLYFSGVLDNYLNSLWVGEDSMLLQMLVFLLVGFGLFLLLFTYRYGYFTRRVFSVLLCLLMASQMLFSLQVYVGDAANPVAEWQQYTDLEDVLPEDEVYRVKTDNKYTDANLMGGIGYNNLAHYTSFTTQDYLFTAKKLGYSSYWMEVNSNGGTLLTDALLGNRYTVSQFDYLNIAEDPVYENELYRVYENPLTLSLGLVVGADQVREEIPDLERMQVQQYLYETLLDTSGGQLIIPYAPTEVNHIDITQEAGRYSFTWRSRYSSEMIYEISVEGQQVLYFDCFDEYSNSLVEDINQSFDIKVNGKTVTTNYPNQSVNGLVELGTFEDTTVTVQLQLNKNCDCASFGVFGLDVELLQQAVEQMEDQQAQITYEGTTFTAFAYSDQAGQVLYLSIPYDEGFSCTVNGKAVEVQRANSAFMAIPLEQGENTVVLTYTPPGYWAGVILTGMGVLALIGFLWYQKKNRPPMVRLNRFCVGAVGALGVLCFLAIYAMPVLVWTAGQFL